MSGSEQLIMLKSLLVPGLICAGFVLGKWPGEERSRVLRKRAGRTPPWKVSGGFILVDKKIEIPLAYFMYFL